MASGDSSGSLPEADVSWDISQSTSGYLA